MLASVVAMLVRPAAMLASVVAMLVRPAAMLASVVAMLVRPAAMLASVVAMLALTVFAMMLLLVPHAAAATTETYSTVAATFPSDLSLCELNRITFKELNSLNCASFCFKTPGCRLFCYLGTECVLYQAWVTTSYNGSYADIVNLYCYSSYDYGFDLAPGATFTAVSDNYRQPPEKAAQGYYCNNPYYCSISFVSENPWWMADLGQPTAVSMTVVKTREDLMDFSNVEIRLGNSPTFTSNPLFASYTGPPTHLEILVFTPSAPMTGRYLSLQSITSYGALGICNIQIIAA